VLTSRAGQQALLPGRVVLISTKRYPNNIGVVMKTASSSDSRANSDELGKLVTVLVSTDKSSSASETSMSSSTLTSTNCNSTSTTSSHIGSDLSKAGNASDGNATSSLAYRIDPVVKKSSDWEVFQLPLASISRITKEKLKVDVSKLVEKADRVSLTTTIQQLLRLLERFPLGPPEMDPFKELKLTSMDFVDKYNKRNQLAKRMASSKCQNCPKLSEQYSLMDKHARLRSHLNALRFALSEENLQLMPEFQQRLSVLHKLHYIGEDKTVLIKGRVAREINTVTDELIATELIFENVLTPLNPAEIVALLSCLIFEVKSSIEPTLPPKLTEAKDHMVAIAIGLANLQLEQNLPITPEDYLKNNINIGLMEVVYEWARQMPFADICQLTDVLEGSIVRCIVRLDETCKEIRNAARIIGDTALYSKMEKASEKIKRDIVFASSLYVS